MVKKQTLIIAIIIIVAAFIISQSNTPFLGAMSSPSLSFLQDRCTEGADIYDCGAFFCLDTASGTCPEAYTQCTGQPIETCSGEGSTQSSGNGVAIIGQPELNTYEIIEGESVIATFEFEVEEFGDYWVQVGIEYVAGLGQSLTSTPITFNCVGDTTNWANHPFGLAPGQYSVDFQLTPEAFQGSPAIGRYQLQATVVTDCGGDILAGPILQDELLVVKPVPEELSQLCGNGVWDKSADEVCDASAPEPFDGTVDYCSAHGNYNAGTLKCGTDCKFDFSSCTSENTETQLSNENICSKTNGATCTPTGPGISIFTGSSGQSLECKSGWCEDVVGLGGRCSEPPKGFEGHSTCLQLNPPEEVFSLGDFDLSSILLLVGAFIGFLIILSFIKK